MKDSNVRQTTRDSHGSGPFRAWVLRATMVIAGITLPTAAAANPVLVDLDGYLIPIMLPGSSPSPSEDGSLQFATTFPETGPSVAGNYIRNFPYAAGHRRVTTQHVEIPRNCAIDNCDARRCGRDDRAQHICTKNGVKVWAMNPSKCPINGLALRNVNRTHVRPQNLQGWRPFGPDGVGRNGFCHGGCSNPNAIVYLNFRLLINQWIGMGRGNVWNDRARCDHFRKNNGPNYREVWAAEVTPDGYGIIPLENNLWKNKAWTFLTRGHRIGQFPRKVTLKNEFFHNVKPPNYGGLPPQCPQGWSCSSISGTPRALAARRPDGKQFVFISGVGSGTTLSRDAADIVISLANLKYGRSSINPTVRGVAKWLARNNQFGKATIVGHSLGAIDAAVLHVAQAAGHTELWSPPTPIPANALKDLNGHTIEAWCGTNDDVCNGKARSMTATRRALGAQIHEINTGTVDPHYSQEYCVNLGRQCIR